MFKYLKKKFFTVFFKVWGWKVAGAPPRLKKYLIVVAPHTSNWDFFVGYSYKHTVDYFDSNFLAKKELFDVPVLGWLMKKAGGYPVVRSKKMGLVDQVVELYNNEDAFVTTIAPEGTRSLAEKWKTGFYHIAQNANIPIVKIGLDYSTKTMHIADPYYVKGNKEQEIEEMKEYFRQFKGKFPENGKF